MNDDANIHLLGLGGNTLYMLPSVTGGQSLGVVIQNDIEQVFVIDGGFKEDAIQIEQMVCSLSSKKSVTAWFITHGHKDHIDAVTEVIRRRQLSIGALYYDIPDEDYLVNDSQDKSTREAFYSAVGAAGINVITPKVGERHEFGSAAFKVLKTPDTSVVKNACNNSSVIYKMITKEKSVLFLADLGEEGGDALLQSHYREITSDIVQMAHHGQGGVKESLYRAISPKYALWPTPDWLWENRQPYWRTLEVRGWMEALGVINFITKDGMIIIR